LLYIIYYYCYYYYSFFPNAQVSSFAITASLFKIDGALSFINTSFDGLSISSSSYTIYSGNSPSLYFNVSSYQNLVGSRSTPSLILNSTLSSLKRIHFNNTVFTNISCHSNTAGSLVSFVNSNAGSELIFEYCKFTVLTQSTTYGTIFAAGYGIVNITATIFDVLFLTYF
jgi:hypothetical protein